MNGWLTAASGVQISWSSVDQKSEFEVLKESLPVMGHVSGWWVLIIGVITVASVFGALLLKFNDRDEASSLLFIFGGGGGLVAVIWMLIFAPVTYYQPKYDKEMTAWAGQRFDYIENLPTHRVDIADWSLGDNGVHLLLKTTLPVQSVTVDQGIVYDAATEPYLMASWVEPIRPEDGDGYWANATLHFPAKKQ